MRGRGERRERESGRVGEGERLKFPNVDGTVGNVFILSLPFEGKVGRLTRGKVDNPMEI
jgi:hypothetical protein